MRYQWTPTTNPDVLRKAQADAIALAADIVRFSYQVEAEEHGNRLKRMARILRKIGDTLGQCVPSPERKD